MKFQTIILSAAILFSFAASAQTVVFEGKVDGSVRSALKKAGYTPIKGNSSTEDADLIIVGADSPVSPDVRTNINNALSGGNMGNVIFLGNKAFDYSPVPVDPKAIVDFNDSSSFSHGHERREKAARFTENPAVNVIQDPEGHPALEMKTTNWVSCDYFVKVDFSDPISDDRTVLTFNARGNEYMDMLSLEIKDKDNKTWIAFLPLTCEWQRYALSLADFLPLARKANEEYALLKPSDVRQLLVGTNIKVIWYEHATCLGLSELAFAKNTNPYYAPTSSLQMVGRQMFVRVTSLPEDIYDPAWRVEHPFDATRTNPSDKNEFPISYKDRESRIVKLTHGTVEFFPMCARKGAAVALLPRWSAELNGDILKAAELMTRTPMTVGTRFNTSKGTVETGVIPQLTIWIRNPLHKEVKTTLTSVIGDRLKYSGPADLQELCLQERILRFNAVPEDFPFNRFEWNIELEGYDNFTGCVDLEKALIWSCRHMVRNQSLQKDGRFSNHFFGDAYGVRAMMEFVWHARRDPALVSRNAALLADCNVDTIEKAAFRWLDMMCDRQLEDGMMYMGYSEPKPSSNVADMGEVCVCVFQMLPYIEDAARRERYSSCFEKTLRWAEQYYIANREDSLRVAELYPEEARKGNATPGHYGLGVLGLKPRSYGPIWVNELLMPAHCAILTHGTEEQKAFFRPIFERNSAFIIHENYHSKTYYHAESVFWHWMVTGDPEKKKLLAWNFTKTQLLARFNADPMEPYRVGGRAGLNALPLLYYRRYFEDSPSVRAVLLKYWWAYAELESFHGPERQYYAFPKATHGEGLGSSKFAGHAAVAAVESLWPGATL